MMPMRRSGIAIILALVMPAGTAAVAHQVGQTPDKPVRLLVDKETLTNKRLMTVEVDDVPELKSQMDTTAIKTDVELRLRQTGITVAAPNSDEAKTAPVVNVLVGVILNGAQYDYNINVEFIQWVEVHGVDSKASTWARAITWEHGGHGYVGQAILSQLRDRISDNVSAFLNDWLEMNPKRH